MIRTQTAQSAIDLAQEFDKRGLALTFKGNTFLEALYASSTIDYVQPAPMPEFEPTAGDLSLDTQFVPFGASRAPHDVALEACVLEIADAVRHHLDVARNVVKPVIKEFYERVEAAMKAMPTTAQYNPDTVKLRLPEVMDNGLFSTLIDGYKGTNALEVDKTVGLPEMDEDSALKLLDTGNTTLDADAKNWITRLGAPFFMDVFRQVFGLGGSAMGLSQAINAVVTGPDTACAAFLMAKNLFGNPPPGLSMSLSEYNSRLDAVLRTSAVKLLRSYELFKAWEDTKTVLIGATDATVRVVGSVYDDWTASGGNPAILLGASLSDRSMHTVAELADRGDQYLDVWTQHNRNLTATMTARRYVDTIALLKFKTEQILSDRAKHCFSELVGDDADINFASPCVQDAKKRCELLIDGFTNDDLTDLWFICTEIVALGIFHYTDAYQLLMGIDAAMKEDPRLSPEDAAKISAAEYITDYVVDQMEVVSIDGQ